MAVYGGYDPGTFQAWALNLFNGIFVSAGIARGFQVTQNSPTGMSILATLDGTHSDAVVYLANGCWLRIDAVTTFSIGSNSSGSTRTDALVATVDPSGNPTVSLAVQANWSNGFTAPATNQFVIALISVANGASSILNANITMNAATASITTGAGGANSLQASDGVGLTVQDSSASSTLSVILTGLTSGVGRGIAIQTMDSSAIGHTSTFDMAGNLNVPGAFQASLPGSGSNALTALDLPVSGTPTVNNHWQLYYDGATGNLIFKDVTHTRTVFGLAAGSGEPFGPNGQALPQLRSIGGGSAGGDIWEGATDPGASAGEGDLWVAG